jgi:deazaflavin-dependent oxidoreductase (nitroreductase family)
MWYNSMMRWLLRSPLYFVVGKNMMLMTYKGRKSGKGYTIPMNYLEIGDVLYTISSRERVWWRNMRGSADVTLRLRGGNIPARAEAIEDQAEVTNILFRCLKKAPQLTKYMNIQIDADGSPNFEDVVSLAQEKVIVSSKLEHG